MARNGRAQRVNIRLVICALLFALVTTACVQTEPAERAHDFTLTTLTGDTVTLSDQNDWTLINFWATWCAPCITEMPYLQTIAERGDIDVWGINMRENQAELLAFTQEHGITFPILLNPPDDVILAYRGSLPRSYLVAPDGTIAQTFYGPLLPEQFEQWYAEAVGQ